MARGEPSPLELVDATWEADWTSDIAEERLEALQAAAGLAARWDGRCVPWSHDGSGRDAWLAAWDAQSAAARLLDHAAIACESDGIGALLRADAERDATLGLLEDVRLTRVYAGLPLEGALAAACADLPRSRAARTSSRLARRQVVEAAALGVIDADRLAAAKDRDRMHGPLCGRTD